MKGEITKEEKDEPSYPVKKVQFRTCVELYKKWRVTKLRYKTAPSNGIEVEVEYADTLELIDPKKESNFDMNTKIPEFDVDSIKCLPRNETGENQNYKPLTALCLHGAPGCHKDYKYLINYFIKRNVRVIAPKFPNYDLTKRTPFCHSPAEKSEYIKDFLSTIKVDSSSLFVAARLINDSLNAFSIQMQRETTCKKCEKSKKNKKCSKCEESKKKESKDTEICDSSTDDEEDEDLFRRFSLNFDSFEKMYAEKKRLEEKGKDHEESNLTGSEPSQEQQIKQNIEEKSVEKNDKIDEKQDEKQVKLSDEDEVCEESHAEEVNDREARKLFSTSTLQKSKLYFGSLILLNVVSHRRSKLMNPVLKNSLYEPSSFFYQLKISRSVVRFCGRIYLTIFGSPVDYNNFDNLILTLTTVLRSNIKSLRLQLERILRTNLPLIFFFAENDRLISKNQSYELANFLNVKYITRDFSDPTNRSYDVYNYNNKKPKTEVNNNDINELNQETLQVESRSTTSSEEFDSLRHQESEIESDATSSTGQSSSNEENSLKSKSDLDLKSKEIDQTANLTSDQLDINQLQFPYAVSIKKGRHYSHITHSHVMDNHIGRLITVLNLGKN